MTTVAHVTVIDASLRYLLLNQLRAIRAAGFNVLAVSRAGENKQIIEQVAPHVDVPLTRRITPMQDVMALAKLVIAFRKLRPSVVHTHTSKGGLLGQLAATIARVPVRVHTVHGFYFSDESSPWMRRIWSRLEQLTLALADHSLSQNAEDIATALAEGLCAADKLEFLGNGIDLTRFDPGTLLAARAAIRESLGLGPEHVVVTMVGRVVAEKGYREAFAAAAALRSRAPNVRWLFVGPLDHEKADALTQDALHQAGIADIAQLLGHRDDIERLLAASDVFTLPSYREGMPRSVMEAAAMGLPGVVTNVRGCREATDDGVTGTLVPVRNAEALATAIEALCNDASLRARMGHAARQKAEAEFDERRIFAHVIATYERLLGKRS